MVKFEFPSDSLSDYYRNWTNDYVLGKQLEEIFRRALKLATNNNIMVYDDEAKPDFFSKRLVHLIKRTGRDKFYKELTALYVSQPVVFDDNPLYEQKPGDVVTAVYGVPIIISPVNLETIFEEDKTASKAYRKPNITLCVFGDNYILGGF